MKFLSPVEVFRSSSFGGGGGVLLNDKTIIQKPLHTIIPIKLYYPYTRNSSGSDQRRSMESLVEKMRPFNFGTKLNLI